MYTKSLTTFNNIAVGLAIAMTPLYWFINTGPGTFTKLKYILLLTFSITMLCYSIFSNFKDFFKDLANPTIKSFIILTLIVILTSLPGLHNADISMARYFYTRFIAGLLFTAVFYITHKRLKNGFSVLFCASIFMCVIASIHILGSMYIFDVVNLAPRSDYFTSTSFGALATNYSDGLGLFAVFLPGYAVVKKFKFSTFLLLCLISLNTIVFSQLIAGGRSGVITSILLLLSVSFFSFPRKFAYISIPTILINFALLIYFSLFYSNYNVLRGTQAVSKLMPNISTHKAGQIGNSGKIRKNINNHKFSEYTFYASRTEMLKTGLKLMIDSPLMGHGFGYPALENKQEIHNVFLKYGVDAGTFFLITLLSFCFFPAFLFIRIMRSKFNIFSLNNSTIVFSLLVLAIGLFPAMLNPRLIFGGTNLCMIWWATYGIALSEIENKRLNLMKT